MDDLAPRDPMGSWVIKQMADGTRIWLDLGDYGVSRYCLNESFEPLETAFLRSVLRRGDTFLDIGANVGWFTILAAKAVGPEGRVIAFEPRPDTCGALESSVAENGFEHVSVHNLALGAASERLSIGTLISAANPGGTWLLASQELDAAHSDGYQRFEVDVRKLDDINIESCDLVKIDIEGAENLAISGGRETLCRFKPMILSEINPTCLAAVSKVTVRDYLEALASLGYVAHAITEHGPGAALPSNFSVPKGEVFNVVFMPHP